MSTRPRRSSTRPAPAADAAAAAAGVTQPSNAPPSPSATSPNEVKTGAPVNSKEQAAFVLSSKKLKLLKAAFESLLDSALSPADSSSTLLSALPKDLHAKHALVIQRQTEKVLASIRKNCMNEFEVILSEHRLPEKLGEVELLESQSLTQGGLALGGLEGVTPTPEQAIRTMIEKARKSEKDRLLRLAEALEAENRELREELVTVNESLKDARIAVKQKEEYANQLYATISKEEI